MLIHRSVYGYLLILLLLSACSSNKDQVVTKPITIPYVASSTKLVTPSVTKTTYRIGPGDELDIRFYNNPELDDRFTVNPDGTITLRYIDRPVKAAGATPAELSRTLNRLYAHELRNPRVNVNVRTFARQRIYLSGEINNPGFIPLTQGMNAMQAIIEAGGAKESATLESVIIVRKSANNKPIPTRIDLKTGSSYALGYPLHAEDVVYVPRSYIADAGKFVKEHVGDLLLVTGFSVSPYISPVPTTTVNPAAVIGTPGAVPPSVAAPPAAAPAPVTAPGR